MISFEQVFGLTENHLANYEQGDANLLLHTQSLASFKKLHQAALAQDIDIKIASSFRSFERQALIWNNKFTGKRPVFDKQNKVVDMSKLNDWQKVQAILSFSALPGASRHHWGTDIDIYDNNALPQNYQLQLSPTEYQESGIFSSLSSWLEQHATVHDFYRPYQATNMGIAQELWHISYGPTAKLFVEQFKQDCDLLLPALENNVQGYNVIRQHFDTILADYVFCAAEFNS
ncbi:MAG: M15 family metallopeptidase [Gammaproteobacteria bacterium]|nr:M15 family metallopeptidase [Gammaproteobacteria bacterium]